MKKLVIVSIILCMLFTVGCSTSERENLSYKQTSYLVGQVENYKVTVVSGLRESPYIADGVAGELVEFCIVTLRPVNYADSNKTYSYRIEVDGQVLEGSMNKDTFGSTLSVDLGVDYGECLTAVKFFEGENEISVSLENMVSNALISGEEGLKKAKEEFREKLKKEEAEGKTREIYLKFVSDSMGQGDAYYWYIAFVGSNKDYSAVLIDVVSGDIIAKRE